MFKKSLKIYRGIKAILLARLHEHRDICKILRLSTTKETALKRAVGALWALFYNDHALERIIKEACLQRKNYLPFLIADRFL